MIEDDFHGAFSVADQVLFRGCEGIVSLLIAKFIHRIRCSKQYAFCGFRMNEFSRVVVSDEVTRITNIVDGFVGAPRDLRLIVDAVKALRVDGIVFVAYLVEYSIPVLGPFSH